MTNEQIKAEIFNEYAKAAIVKMASENSELSVEEIVKEANYLMQAEESVAEDFSKVAHLEGIGKSLANLTWQGHLPVLAKYASGNARQRRTARRAAPRPAARKAPAATATKEVVDVAKKVKGMSHGALAAIVAGAVGAGAIAASAITDD